MRISKPFSVLILVPLLAAGWTLFTSSVPEDTEVWVAVSRQKLEHEIGLVGRIEPVETSVLNAPFEGVLMAHE